MITRKARDLESVLEWVALPSPYGSALNRVLLSRHEFRVEVVSKQAATDVTTYLGTEHASCTRSWQRHCIRAFHNPVPYITSLPLNSSSDHSLTRRELASGRCLPVVVTLRIVGAHFMTRVLSRAMCQHADTCDKLFVRR